MLKLHEKFQECDKINNDEKIIKNKKTYVMFIIF